MHTATLGLGANLGDRLATLQRAVDLLAEQGVRAVRCSRVWETEPVGGPPGQPAYLNAVIRADAGDLASRRRARGRAPGRGRARTRPARTVGSSHDRHRRPALRRRDQRRSVAHAPAPANDRACVRGAAAARHRSGPGVAGRPAHPRRRARRRAGAAGGAAARPAARGVLGRLRAEPRREDRGGRCRPRGDRPRGAVRARGPHDRGRGRTGRDARTGRRVAPGGAGARSSQTRPGSASS